MPSLTTTTRLFTSQTFGTLGVALPQIIRFLISDHPSFTGPNWTLVEAYSQGQAARQVPSNPHDLDSLTTTNAWASGTQVTGSWVVLENSTTSLIGENANHFQLYLEYDTTTIINFMLIPFADFITGTSAITPPNFPTSSFGNASGSFTVNTITGATASGTYSAVADESMFCMVENLVRINFFVGEINSTMNSGTTRPDSRPYVIRRTGATSNWSATNLAARLSPFDNTSVLTSSLFIQQQISADGSNVIHDDLPDDRFDQDVLPVGLLFTDNNHKHFMGFMKNLYSVADGLIQSGTINTPSGYFMYTANGAGVPQMAIPWNTQSYGSASIGTFISPPEFSSNDFAFLSVDSQSTGTAGTTTVVVNSVPTGTYDLNRIRITYPFNRVRRRMANISG